MRTPVSGLVLSRRVGESILIGGDIVVTVVRIGPGAARLHISAPKELSIVRKEIAGRETPIQLGNEGICDLGRRVDDAV